MFVVASSCAAAKKMEPARQENWVAQGCERMPAHAEHGCPAPTSALLLSLAMGTHCCLTPQPALL